MIKDLFIVFYMLSVGNGGNNLGKSNTDTEKEVGRQKHCTHENYSHDQQKDTVVAWGMAMPFLR
jgi:hypothetical protein